MTHERHDAPLERLLGPALRASRQDEAGCPDSETLAAWSENGLLPQQRIQVESHLAGCERCQAHLAALARSEHASPPTPTHESLWRSWRLLVPLAAGATAVALWVVIRPDSRRSEQSARPLAGVAVQPPATPATAPTPQLDKAAAARSNVSTPALSREEAVRKAPMPAKAARDAAKEAAAGRQARAQNEPKTRDERVTVTAASPTIQGSMAHADAVAPVEIVSSDPSVRWRIRGSELEHTTDGGATWTKQSTGTTVLLSAGAAPSPDVCWVVGRRGTVLRSIDGLTWQAIPFPEPVDLVQVESAAPAQARVTTADARHFTTDDGGATWRPGSLQEF